jgi:tRNA A37 N6-isopentenylltransferase MiaA
MKNKIVFLSGVTGIGKTEIARKLAKYMKSEIIMGDSI